MSFPHRIWGNYGDEKVSGSTKMHPLGTRMELPDASIYAYGQMLAGTAGLAGHLYQGNNTFFTADALAGSGMAVQANAAIDARTISVTMGATTAMAATTFEDGYIHIENNTGEGHRYRIAKASSAAAGSTSVITLEGNDKVKVALAAGTTTVGIKENPFQDLILTTADSVGLNAIAGVLPAAASAAHFTWVQRRGVCACIADDTVIVGEPVVCGTATTGALGPMPVPAATTEARIIKEINPIGYCLSAAASVDYGLFDLCLE